MAYALRAVREKPMSAREKRVDELIERYHDYDHYYGKTDTEVEIVVHDGSATMAASEFRACGFVVGGEQMQTP